MLAWPNRGKQDEKVQEIGADPQRGHTAQKLLSVYAGALQK